MRIAKFQASGSDTSQVGILEGDTIVPLELTGDIGCLQDILESDQPEATIQSLVRQAPISMSNVTLLAPIDDQEVWAAGVTYKRSQTARMEESETAADCYDRVYVSDRPELFLKATPHRVSGPGEPVRIRIDSTWNVPEPELALVINSRNELVGFSIGNDMSSRDIEGDNPLYLPQAKVYNQCCGLGPCITLSGHEPHGADMGIRLSIERNGAEAFSGTTSIDEMARSFEHLIGYLTRDNSLPNGAFLLTGTGIVPDNDFTLQAGDIVSISIDGIGTLTNHVIQG